MTSPPASTPRTARALAREAITHEILAAARARLAEDGPAALSLRAVARDVGMVSSAVYRYVENRDALLTALIVECYDELGAAVEDAEAAVADRADVTSRWLAACRAVRTWSVTHPGEFRLLYGTPVPGYAAPPDTIDPATRLVLVLVAVVADAHDDGAVPPLSPTAQGDLTELVAGARDFVAARGLIEDAPPELVVRTLMAWTTVLGTVSFEMFGHLANTVSDPEAWFDVVALRLAADLGIGL
ncbi:MULTISPECIES: TetR-like C-terminal domain-containing protein [Isoptericola]|uniref:TetR-like C-terminal domain-containing protein n=1 Tax=Isoptericola TaxID=254250 RepID=UPI001FAF63C1|nr:MULTISPECIES: TetR-like C-terminal domain-containing protein [Isoptericola]MCK0116309.1 TetR/AcrR family transcriptional regulator [Isoptericola sp. S6320L]